MQGDAIRELGAFENIHDAFHLGVQESMAVKLAWSLGRIRD